MINSRGTHVEGVRFLNGKIYVEDDASLDIQKELISESETIFHSLFTKKAIKKWYSQTLYSASDELDKLAVGEKNCFGNGDEKIEIIRETENLYRCENF